MTRGIFKEDDDKNGVIEYDPFDRENEMKESMRIFKDELVELIETYINPWLND